MLAKTSETACDDAFPPNLKVAAEASIDLSVIVCTANRADDLAFMLREFAKLDFPPDRTVELVVVDNGSTDDTKMVIQRARSFLPLPVIYVYEPTRGLSRARNTGLTHCRGSIIAWTDDDCVASKDWLACILKHFDDDRTLTMLGGRVELYDNTLYPVSINPSLVPYRVSDTNVFPGSVLYGCNMAFRRHLVTRIGPFDIRLGAGTPLRAAEDADYVYRAHKAGYEVAYTPDVVIYHNHHRRSSAEAFRVRQSYAFSDGAFLAKHFISGDLCALKFFYWRLWNLLASNTAKERSLIFHMFAGTVAFVMVAFSRSARTAILQVAGHRFRVSRMRIWRLPTICK